MKRAAFPMEVAMSLRADNSVPEKASGLKAFP